MNTSLLCRSQVCYGLADSFCASEESSAIRMIDPSDTVHEDMVLRKLGSRGWERLYHFKNFYSQGWGDNGNGRPLSPRALEGLYRFIDKMEWSNNAKPSLFLTDDGFLELCWEDGQGKAVQIEFTSSGASYYVEADEKEGFVKVEQMASLPKFVRC